MSNWPLSMGGVQEGLGDVLNITAGTPDNPGSWVEVFSATALPWDGFWVWAGSKGANQNQMWDIAIGAGGSEQTIVTEYYVGSYAPNAIIATLYYPIAVAQGSRVAARHRNTSNGVGARFAIMGVSGNELYPPGHHVCETFGADTVNTIGTEIDPGASLGTFGSWVELTSGLTWRTSWLNFEFGSNQNTAMTTDRWEIQVARGAGGSEEVILDRLSVMADETDDDLCPYNSGPFSVDLPAGTRVAMRALNVATTNATDRLFDTVMHAIA